jgi:hypothetical protein
MPAGGRGRSIVRESPAVFMPRRSVARRVECRRDDRDAAKHAPLAASGAPNRCAAGVQIDAKDGYVRLEHQPALPRHPPQHRPERHGRSLLRRHSERPTASTGLRWLPKCLRVALTSNPVGGRGEEMHLPSTACPATADRQSNASPLYASSDCCRGDPRVRSSDGDRQPGPRILQTRPRDQGQPS